jgi:hypothetical protein
MNMDDESLDQQSLWKSYKGYTGKLEFEEMFGSLNVDLFGKSVHRPSELAPQMTTPEKQPSEKIRELGESLKNTLHFFSKKFEHVDERALLEGLVASREPLGKLLHQEASGNIGKLIGSMLDFGLTMPTFSANLFINKIFDLYCDSLISNLRMILANVFSVAKNEPESMVHSLSKTEKKMKRQWTKEEEFALLELMKLHYPMQIPNEAFALFISKYNRSKSSLVNKIQKLKNKFISNFESKENEIIQSFPFIKDYKEADVTLEQAVINSLYAKRQLSYNQIIDFLDLPKYNLDLGEQLDKVLYKLLNEKRIFCDERMFVELQKDLGASDKKSSIIDKIERHLQKLSLQSITFEDLKDFVITEFPIVQKELTNFDEQLVEFLKQSGRFLIKSQRVFY